uniref:Fascin n=1 Tax=Dendrocoelum lacteum TaxID=27895 RepID=T1E1F2_9PLAT
MNSNGVNGSAMHTPALIWEMGIVNGAGKFLTAETFGFKINVSATTLKKKQIWTIIPDTVSDHFFIKSHLNKYLSSDKDGKVSCEIEECGKEEQFLIEYCPKGTGKWSFKSAAYGYYFTGSEDRIDCFSKTPSWWSVRLAVHPQMHMQNMKRQRYVRLQDSELRGDQTIPWGYDSLITLEHSPCGRVAICSRDHRYLHREGHVTEEMSEDTVFGLEVRGGATPGMAFKDKEGKYLTLIGNTGTLKSKNKAIGKDELFIMEISFPQVGLKAHNGKYASIKQGMDLYANQADAGEKEIFQFEYQNKPGQWKIRSSDGKYWTVSSVNNGIKATSDGRDASSAFNVESLASGKILLKASNDMFVTSRKLGVMTASGDKADDPENLFQLILLNRPLIIFKSEFGLVGTRNGRIECNMSSYESFELQSVNDGNYNLKVRGDKDVYWKVADDGSIKVDASIPAQQFVILFQSGTHCAILAPNGRYIRGEQNGLMKADSEEINKASLWEF